MHCTGYQTQPRRPGTSCLFTLYRPDFPPGLPTGCAMHRTGRPEDSPIAGYQLPLFMLYRPDFRRLPCTRQVDSLLPSFLLPVHADSPSIHTGTATHNADIVKSLYLLC